MFIIQQLTNISSKSDRTTIDLVYIVVRSEKKLTEVHNKMDRKNV